jgi:hypothetical protein
MQTGHIKTWFSAWEVIIITPDFLGRKWSQKYLTSACEAATL